MSSSNSVSGSPGPVSGSTRRASHHEFTEGGLQLSQPLLVSYELAHCVRSFCSTVLPAALVVLLTLYRVPLPLQLAKPSASSHRRSLRSSLSKRPKLSMPARTRTKTTPLTRPQMPLEPQAFRYVERSSSSGSHSRKHSYGSPSQPSPPSFPHFALLALLTSLSWLYATIRPIAIPSATLPFDLLALYVVHFVVLVLKVGGAVDDVNVLGIRGPNGLVVLGWGADAVALGVLLCAE